MDGREALALAMAFAGPPQPPPPALAPPPYYPHISYSTPLPPLQPHHNSHPYHSQTQQQPPVGHGNPELLKIHTIFIAGLPEDVKPREIHNLFRRCPGFDTCHLKYTGKENQVVSFATFFNHQSAVAALNAFNGVVFDPETGITLHVELARSNSRTKRPWGSGPYSVIDKRAKVANDAQENENDDGDGGYDDPSGMDNSISSKKDDLAAPQRGKMGDLDSSHDTPNVKSEKPVSGELLPCSTLFIANLGPTCTQEELEQALSKHPGFNVLKIRARGGMPVAFADFEEVEHATKAMEALHGSLLPSSDRGGMHVEYAKAKMRKH